MIYKYNSDITSVEKGVIAHGVNCQMKMGSGVAKALYTKWPKVRTAYLAMNKYKRPGLGMTQIFWVEGRELAVANCFTQEYYGNDGAVYADLEAIKTCMRIVSVYHRPPIHIPKIGCGLGGLDWKDVEEALLEIEEDRKTEFVVHQLEGEH